MEAAQTHRQIKVQIQVLCSVYKQLHVMQEVQNSSGGEAHQKDDKHQRAAHDV